MEVTRSDTNHIPVLQWVLKLLQILGCCRMRPNSMSVFTLASFVFIVFLQLWDIFGNWENLASLKRIRYLPACFMSIVKGSLLVIKSNQCLSLLNYLRYFWNADDFESETRRQHYKIFRVITFLCPFYISVCWSFCVALSALPWFNMDVREFVLGDYSFCDKFASFKCWFSMWLWQASMLLIQEIPVNCSFDCIFIICTAYVYNGCELLKTALEKLETSNFHKRKIALVKIVEQHHVVMMFVKNMNEFYTGFMLVQFWCSLWSLILYLYMIVIEGIPPNIQDAILFGTLYAIFTFQILIYSVGGTIIQEQLKSIPNAMFQVNWHEKGRTKLRQDLSFMIIRAQNARSLTVGKMTDLNLVLFVSVIKNSLSVFALILQLENSEVNQQ